MNHPYSHLIICNVLVSFAIDELRVNEIEMRWVAGGNHVTFSDESIDVIFSERW